MPKGTWSEPPLAFEETGSGPPVLLVHGPLSDRRLWADVAAALSPNFHAIRCSLRADSRQPRERQLNTSRDLLALADRLELSAVHLAGHGPGCATVAGLAMQAPHRASSLTLVDPIIPRTDTVPAIQETWHLETLLQWLSVGYGPAVRRPEHIAVLRQIIGMQTHARVTEPGSLPAPFGPNGMSQITRLESLPCPVMVIIGEKTEPETKALVAATFPQGRFRLVQVPGAGRQCPLEAPSAVAQFLTRFLQGGDPVAGASVTG